MPDTRNGIPAKQDDDDPRRRGPRARCVRHEGITQHEPRLKTNENDVPTPRPPAAMGIDGRYAGVFVVHGGPLLDAWQNCAIDHHVQVSTHTRTYIHSYIGTYIHTYMQASKHICIYTEVQTL